MPCKLDNSEVSAANGALDLVETNPERCVLQKSLNLPLVGEMDLMSQELREGLRIMVKW